jgi:hypothetical protein
MFIEKSNSGSKGIFFMTVPILVAVLALFACSGEGQPPFADAGSDGGHDAAVPDSGDTGMDAGAGDSGMEDAADSGADTGPTIIKIGPTNGTFKTDFKAEIKGESAGPKISEITVEGNTGEIVFDKETIPLVVYSEFYWPLAESQTITILGVESDRLSAFWVYCDGKGNLTGIWYENTAGDEVTYEEATGSCSINEGPVSTELHLPGIEFEAPGLLEGFTITGTGISYDGKAPGHLKIDGNEWKAYPFNLVDCSKICGDPGAYELHSIFLREETGEGCFGIIYLWVPQDGTLTVNESLCLPSLNRPSPAYKATYKH